MILYAAGAVALLFALHALCAICALYEKKKGVKTHDNIIFVASMLLIVAWVGGGWFGVDIFLPALPVNCSNF